MLYSVSYTRILEMFYTLELKLVYRFISYWIKEHLIGWIKTDQQLVYVIWSQLC